MVLELAVTIVVFFLPLVLTFEFKVEFLLKNNINLSFVGFIIRLYFLLLIANESSFDHYIY